MNTRALFFAAFLSTFHFLYAQKVDRKEIERQVSNSSADTYYPKLLDRFNAFDSTLTIDEYRLLYYGFVFQKDYSPYGSDNKKEINDAIKKNDFELAAKISDELLNTTPVSLTGNYWKGYALFQLNENDPKSIAYRNRYFGLRDAIVSSGDGQSCETAFKTIFVSDEYNIMFNHLMVVKFSSQQLVGNCDRFAIEPSEKFNRPDLYFDTSETLSHLNKVFDAPSPRKKKKAKKH